MSTGPLSSNVSFASARILERMDTSADRKLSVQELKTAVDTDQDGAVTDPELSATGIAAEDQATIKAALATHESDPTSVLVNFSPTSEELTATVVFPTVPSDENPEAPATSAAENITPLETFPHPDLSPGHVIRDEALTERIGEMQGQISKGLERLQQQPQTPEVIAATEQLTTLQTLLASGGADQVKNIQDHLLAFDKTLPEGQGSIEDRLTYTAASGEKRNNDNLYGALTDAALNDYITHLSNQSSAEAEVPAAETGTVTDEANTASAPVNEEVAVTVSETPTETVADGSENAETVAEAPVAEVPADTETVAGTESVEPVQDAQDAETSETAEPIVVDEPVADNPAQTRVPPATNSEYEARMEAASQTVEQAAPALARMMDQHADFLQASYRLSYAMQAAQANQPSPFTDSEIQAARKTLEDMDEGQRTTLQERFQSLNQQMNRELAGTPEFESFQKAVTEKLALLIEGRPQADASRDLAFFQPASFDNLSFDGFLFGGDSRSQRVMYA